MSISNLFYQAITWISALIIYKNFPWFSTRISISVFAPNIG